MKVLLVCHRYPPVGVAGVERHSAQTARALSTSGHKVTVLTCRPSGAPPTFALERENRHGIEVVSIAGGGPRPEAFPDRERALEGIFERMLAEVVPDLVLATHLMHHSPGYVAIAQRWGIPVVLELHDFFAICPRAHLLRRSGDRCGGPEGGSACARHCFPDDEDASLRWALREETFADSLRRADEAIAPSRYVASVFEPVREAPVRVIEDAISQPGPVLREEGAAEGLRLASIGVTVPHKGFEVVVDALRLAALERASYTILGIRLEPDARKLMHSADRVAGLDLHLFGGFEPDDLPMLLADADALVVPSVVPETYSMVVREAFACGVPVIASRIGALPEAIRDGENGWLFEPGDAHGLAALLQLLQGDRRLLRRAAAEIGRGDFTTVEQRTPQLEALLERVVRNRRAGRARPPAPGTLTRMREALRD